MQDEVESNFETFSDSQAMMKVDVAANKDSTVKNAETLANAIETLDTDVQKLASPKPTTPPVFGRIEDSDGCATGLSLLWVFAVPPPVSSRVGSTLPLPFMLTCALKFNDAIAARNRPTVSRTARVAAPSKRANQSRFQTQSSTRKLLSSNTLLALPLGLSAPTATTARVVPQK